MKKSTLSYGVWTITGVTLVAGLLPALAQDGKNTKANPVASKETMHNMAQLQEKRTLVVNGEENWEEMRGFGKEAGMTEMMTLMMVGGSGMEHMKMKSMKMGNMNGSDQAMGNTGEPASQGMPVKVTLKTNPPVVGDNTLDILMTDANGKPVTGLKLTATVAMTSMDMGTEKPKLAEGKDGHYAVTVNFSMKGLWRVILMSEAKSKKTEAVYAALDFNVGSKEKWIQPALRQSAALKITLNTKPDALKVGKNMLDITLLDAAGKPVAGAKVMGTVEMTSMDMGTTHPAAKEGKGGHYVTLVEFSMKGPWRVTLSVTPPKGKPFTKALDFEVKE